MDQFAGKPQTHSSFQNRPPMNKHFHAYGDHEAMGTYVLSRCSYTKSSRTEGSNRQYFLTAISHPIVAPNHCHAPSPTTAIASTDRYSPAKSTFAPLSPAELFVAAGLALVADAEEVAFVVGVGVDPAAVELTPVVGTIFETEDIPEETPLWAAPVAVGLDDSVPEV